MISFSELRNFTLDISVIPVSLIIVTSTKAASLLISTFFLTISSVRLLCFLIESFYFCSWLLSSWTRFLIIWTFSWTCLSSFRLWGSSRLEISLIYLSNKITIVIFRELSSDLKIGNFNIFLNADFYEKKYDSSLIGVEWGEWL